ncbi:hypothetical protein SAMN06265371_10529 [Lutibacter agarilyticus]|uniref:Uncharacterized protein n=1 Tax=Lutibacter agarilyticus TaxID=1109740 RepID=A0A238X7D5_9FLAO|nr:hypothetical protein [Lutibacter agarilyticus]SNR54532.1 hypothetical protein SAMN06265371_10529 [Lutibacter agarilyticus]
MISKLPINDVFAIALDTELNLRDTGNRNYWINLIDEIRIPFSGKLTRNKYYLHYTIVLTNEY